MSDIFDKMMQQGKQKETGKSKSSGGRPMHDAWDGYKKVIEEGKAIALCLKCGKSIRNTGKPRLEAHR